MGITLEQLSRFRRDGWLTPGAAVLDIGSSNLHSASAVDLRAFLAAYGVPEDEPFEARLAAGSEFGPNGGKNESFVGELLERCGLTYLAFDIADGYRTQKFDLNEDRLRLRQRGAFDLVLNFGTTEHVLNQYNSFKVIHEATKTGGYMVHLVPCGGHTDHGYFVYTGRMLFELASCNGYEIIDVSYGYGHGSSDALESARSFKEYFPILNKFSGSDKIMLPDYAITVKFQKTSSAPFRASIETSTSVGKLFPGLGPGRD